MYIANAVRVGAWLLVLLNLLMAFGVIGFFTRMSPAIAVIIERNERSLQACGNMLGVLAQANGAVLTVELQKDFLDALARAKNNITEDEEPKMLALIDQDLQATFAGETASRNRMIEHINHLGRANLEAMIAADQRAQHLGQAGAWGVAFMATLIFILGLIFIRNFTKRIILPMREIHSVVQAYTQGEGMRRCSGVDLSRDMRSIFDGINEILDLCQALKLERLNPPPQPILAATGAPEEQIPKVE